MCLLVNLEVLLPLKPLLSQRSELVQQLRSVLTPAPLVDQHQEGVRPHRPVLTNPPSSTSSIPSAAATRPPGAGPSVIGSLS